MGERKNKYQKYLYSNNNVHVLLPRLSMHEFFGAVGFSANKYIFDIQFWLDLNNLDDNAMFIVDDNIIRLFGYKGSESARNDNTWTNFFKMIRHNFRKDLDYRTTLQKQTKQDGCKGNPNILVLEMTKNAFKLACLLARTKKSIQIYQFFIDLEKYIFAFMQYENEYLNELANAKPPLKSIEADEHIDDSIDLSAFPQISVNSYDNCTVMYLFYLRRYRALKFGISTDLHNRAQRHYRAFGEKPGDVRLVYVLETEHASSIEHSTKHACIQNGWKRHDIIINGSVQTEIIDLNKTSIDAVIRLMNSLLQQHLS